MRPQEGKALHLRVYREKQLFSEMLVKNPVSVRINPMNTEPGPTCKVLLDQGHVLALDRRLKTVVIVPQDDLVVTIKIDPNLDLALFESRSMFIESTVNRPVLGIDTNHLATEASNVFPGCDDEAATAAYLSCRR